MQEKYYDQCPVDQIKLNNNQIRVVASLVALLAVLSLLTDSPFVLGGLVLDFLLRSSELARFSPLNLLASALVKIFRLGFQPTDRAPKKFAALVGSFMTIAIFLFQVFALFSLVKVFTAVLISFALLESVFAFCAGCYLYQYKQRLFQ